MFNAIILGIIEGLTEFLPISSTGHLILFGELLKFNGDFSKVFDVVIQIGAIFSVVVYFRKKLFPQSFDQKDLKEFFSLWSKVAVGVIPAAAVGFTLESLIDQYLFNPLTVAIALIVGGIWILLVDNDKKRDYKYDNFDELDYKTAFLIGCFQTLALIPGMSRSAMTIIGGLIVGTSRQLAAEFSFFMAIPILGGAGLLKLIKYSATINGSEWQILAVGTVVSFIVAYLVIAAFMQYIKKHSFKIFAYYRFVLGAIVLASILVLK